MDQTAGHTIVILHIHQLPSANQSVQEYRTKDPPVESHPDASNLNSISQLPKGKSQVTRGTTIAVIDIWTACVPIAGLITTVETDLQLDELDNPATPDRVTL